LGAGDAVEVNSTERWAPFDKLCYDGCDRATILHEAANGVRVLMPRDQQDEPRRRRER
jgi:hypothetical protein